MMLEIVAEKVFAELTEEKDYMIYVFIGCQDGFATTYCKWKVN